MSYTDDEISEINLDREKRHAGEQQICDECAQDGVVADDLTSGSGTITLPPVLRSMFGVHPPRWYWIHETCAQARAPFHTTA